MRQVMGTGLAVRSQNQRKSGTIKGTGGASFFSSIFPFLIPMEAMAQSRGRKLKAVVGGGHHKWP